MKPSCRSALQPITAARLEATRPTRIQHRTRPLRGAFAAPLAALCLLPLGSSAQFVIGTSSGSTAQDFDSLASSGTNVAWENDATLNGWFLFQKDGASISTYNAGTGSSSTGAFYSFGSDNTDRALGGVASGGAYFGSPATGEIAGWIAFAATNTSAGKLQQFTLGFDGEQWRNGGNATPQTMVLEYGFGPTFGEVTEWAQPGGTFNWTSPIAASTAAAVDGNSTGAAPQRGGVISGLDWLSGSTLWLRWVERNDFGNDHGLAIDNFSFAWLGSTIAPLYWDPNLSAPGVGGTGAWDPSVANWSSTAAGTETPQVFDPGAEAIFAGPGGAVTVASPGVTANGGITFEADAEYTLSGGPITLGGAGTVKTVSETTINSVVEGSAGLTKTHEGRLTLTGANTFTGAILLNGGSLAISSDSALGFAGNALVLGGGTFAPLSSLTLGTGRALTGSGTLRVNIGETLTFQGTVNASNLRLTSNSTDRAEGGRVVFSGLSNAVNSVAFEQPVTIDAPNGISLTGDVTVASEITSRASILGNVALSGSTHRFVVTDTPAAVDLLVEGNLSGNGRLHKVGAGTLLLDGQNGTAFTGGVRLGTAAVMPEAGGRLLISDAHALGVTPAGGQFGLQLQFNDGTLEATTPLTGANALPVGLSLGAGQLNGATFAGSAMEFTGPSSVFKAAGTAFQHRVVLQTNVTLSGPLEAATGTGSSFGLLLSGPGTLTLANAVNTHDVPITVEGATLAVNGALQSPAAFLVVSSGTLQGTGSIAGTVNIGDDAGFRDAILSPGAGIGTLQVASLTLGADAVFKLELNSTLQTADRLRVLESISLGNGVASLSVLDLGTETLPNGLTFTILENEGTLPTTSGFFANLPDGAHLTAGSNVFEIRYGVGTHGNDVFLVVIPEPAGAGLLLLGGLGIATRRLRRG